MIPWNIVFTLNSEGKKLIISSQEQMKGCSYGSKWEHVDNRGVTFNDLLILERTTLTNIYLASNCLR